MIFRIGTYGCAVWAAAVVGVVSAAAAVSPAEWRFTQELVVSSPGLVRTALPDATLGALRPGAEDLRVLDPLGGEVAWVLERAQRLGASTPSLPAASIAVTLQAQSTVVTVETGTTQTLLGFDLDAGNRPFLKAVRVDGSADGTSWQRIASGLPVYQEYQGQTRRWVRIPPAAWPWLRITLDDSRTAPVPISAVRVQVVDPGVSPKSESGPVPIVARDELPGETRLRLDLGSANREILQLEIGSPEAYFHRRASLRERRLEPEGWVEREWASGLLYREPLPDGTPGPAARLEVQRTVPAREVVLVIENGDSPALPVTSVTAFSSPVDLVFWAREAGRFQVLSGNDGCPAPRYDLAAFADRLRAARPQGATWGRLEPNPGYQPPSVAPDPYALGGPLDVLAWKFRKAVPVIREGPQELELDLEVMTRAQPGLADLRLVSGGSQRPFILEPRAALRSLPLVAVPADDPKRPGVSRWILQIPAGGDVFDTVRLETTAPLFNREVALVEESSHPRGAQVRRVLYDDVWRRAPGDPVRPHVLPLKGRETPATLCLEIRNGDNAPLPLTGVTGTYAVGRMHFLAPLAPATTLYYGNAEASAPQYDLQLVSARLLRAGGSRVIAGPEELVPGHRSRPVSKSLPGGVGLFWGALAVVVVVLLLIVRRILPAA